MGVRAQVPSLCEDLLSSIDQPLKVMKDAKTGKDYLLCDYNRDGDSYRSGPHTHTPTPPPLHTPLHTTIHTPRLPCSVLATDSNGRGEKGRRTVDRSGHCCGCQCALCVRARVMKGEGCSVFTDAYDVRHGDSLVRTLAHLVDM